MRIVCVRSTLKFSVAACAENYETRLRNFVGETKSNWPEIDLLLLGIGMYFCCGFCEFLSIYITEETNLLFERYVTHSFQRFI